MNITKVMLEQNSRKLLFMKKLQYQQRIQVIHTVFKHRFGIRIMSCKISYKIEIIGEDSGKTIKLNYEGNKLCYV